MNKLSYGLQALGVSIALTACTPQDPQTMIRKMKCYGAERIIPSEILEIEKSTGVKVGRLCGGHTIITDTDFRSLLTQSVEFTIVSGTQGEMLSIRQDVANFLIPEEKKEVPKPPEAPESKYKLK